MIYAVFIQSTFYVETFADSSAPKLSCIKTLKHNSPTFMVTGPNQSTVIVNMFKLIVLLFAENLQAVAYSAQPLCWSD